jgi:bifunctional non-homologous end joining protein LigD
MTARTTVDVDGTKVEVSNLEKVLYPKVGFTKANVIDYYIRISSVLLPHLKDRPITLKRYPAGVEGFFF